MPALGHMPSGAAFVRRALQPHMLSGSSFVTFAGIPDSGHS